MSLAYGLAGFFGRSKGEGEEEKTKRVLVLISEEGGRKEKGGVGISASINAPSSSSRYLRLMMALEAAAKQGV